jgi:small subunit ribosomal protein S20
MFLVAIKVVQLNCGGDVMPNIKSAIKRVKSSQKAEDLNIAQKNAMRTAVKRAETAKAENAENTDELVSYAVKQVDKANKKNLLHSNKASRMKSKLMTK